MEINLNKKVIKPWTCPKCNALVYVSKETHAYLCHMYRDDPELAKSSHKFFNQAQFNEPEKKEK